MWPFPPLETKLCSSSFIIIIVIYHHHPHDHDDDDDHADNLDEVGGRKEREIKEKIIPKWILLSSTQLTLLSPSEWSILNHVAGESNFLPDLFIFCPRRKCFCLQRNTQVLRRHMGKR